MAERDFDVAIVGTGHCGAQAAAIGLRQFGFSGSIGLPVDKALLAQAPELKELED